MKPLDLFRHPAAYLFRGPMWRRRLAAWWLPRWYERAVAEYDYDWRMTCQKCGQYGDGCLCREHTPIPDEDFWGSA